MNNIYKVIWSKAKNCYVVASEIARSHTKSATGSEKIGGVTRRSLLASLMALSLLCGGLGVASASLEVVDQSGTPGTVTIYTKDEVDHALTAKGAATDVAKNTADIAANKDNINKLETNKLDKDVANSTFATKDALNDLTTTVNGKADESTVATALDGKANKADTLAGYGITDAYTKGDVDDKLNAKADAANVFTKDQTYTRDQVNTKLADYAKSADVYTKTDADAKFATSGALTTAKTELDQKIDNEIANRITSDTALDQKIDNEIANRITSDTALDQKIDKEIANRITSDTALDQKIDKEIQDRENAIKDTNDRTGGIARNTEKTQTTIEGIVKVDKQGNVKDVKGLAAETITTSGNADLKGNVILGTNTANTVTVNGNADFNEAVNMDKGLTVTSGDTTLKGTKVDGKLTVTDETDLKNTKVDGTLTTTGKATFQEAVEMDKGLTVTNGDTTLKGTKVDGKLTVTDEADLKNTKVDGTLGVTGETTLDDKLTVKGEATFEKNVTVEKDLTVNGKLNVGEIYLENNKLEPTGKKHDSATSITADGISNLAKVTELGHTTESQFTHNEKGTFNYAKDGDSTDWTETRSDVTANGVTTEVKDSKGNRTNTSQTASENKTYLEDKDGKNTNSTIDTAKGYDKTIKGENGQTSTKQDELNITNTAEQGTIKNDAMNIENNATGDMTNNVGGKLTTTVTGQATENFNGGLDTNVTGKENHTVTGDQNIHVTGKQTNEIGGDQENTIGGNQTTTVEGNVKEDYKKDLTTTVGGNELHEVTGTKTENVTGKVIENYGNGQETNVTGDQYIHVTGKQTNKIDGDQENIIGGNQTTIVTGDISNKAENITNEANTKLTDKVGDNTRVLDSEGITDTVPGAGGKGSTFKQRIDAIMGNVKTDACESEVTQKGDEITSVVGKGEATISRVTQKKGSIEAVVTDGTSFNHSRDIANASAKTLTGYGKMNQLLDDLNSSTKTITDGTHKTSKVQTALDITNTAADGTITNDAKNIVNNASGDMTNTVGGKLTTTVTGATEENYNGGLTTNVTGEENHTVTGKQNNKVTGKQTNTVEGGQENIISGGQTNTITGGQINNITGDQTTTITGNKTETVTENVTEDYKKNLTTTVGGNEIHDVKGTKTETVEGKVTENFKGGQETNVTGNQDIHVTGKQTNKIDGDQENTIGGNQTTTVTGDISNKAKNITNEASNSITDKVGDHTRVLDSDGITDTVGGSTFKQRIDKIMMESKNVSIKAEETLTNEAKVITNKASEVINNEAVNINNTATGIITSKASEIKNQADKLISNKVGENTWENMENGKITTSIKDGAKQNLTQSDAAGTTQSTVDGGKSTVTIQNADGLTDAVTDGRNTSVQNQTASQIAAAVKDGAGNENASVANATTSANTITNGTKANTVISTADGTSFINSEAAAPVTGASGAGTHLNTTIKGNTITTGKVTMDYAEVMKDLGVRGNANITGKTTTGSLEVKGESKLTGDVTMESNATVKKDLTVEGNTNLKNTKVDGTLDVTQKANFGDSVSIAKDLSVGGNATIKGDVTASSYKVGDKTYISAAGINANDQKITNVADGSISEGSKDAVNGGQLYGVKNDLEGKVNKVGANAAAMANLHPMEFDPDSKWNIAAAIGNYGSETAAALGAFYRPNDDVMVNLSTAFGTGENMVGGGVSVRLGKGGNKLSREETNALKTQVADLTARMDALLSVLNPNMSKDFPDVPENHWAYEAVSRLAGNDIVQGYPDGEFHGERTMTRYEMAEIIYNALSRGAEAEKELVEEFKPELQAMAASEKATAEKAEG